MNNPESKGNNNVLKNKILKLENNLLEVSNNETEYLLATSNILLKYIELEEMERVNANDKDKDKDDDIDIDKDNNNDDDKLFDIYKQKIALTNEYMQIIDPQYIISNNMLIVIFILF